MLRIFCASASRSRACPRYSSERGLMTQPRASLPAKMGQKTISLLAPHSQSTPNKDDLVAVDLLDEEGFDLAAAREPLGRIGMHGVRERTLTVGCCGLRAEVQRRIPVALIFAISDDQEVDV